MTEPSTPERRVTPSPEKVVDELTREFLENAESGDHEGNDQLVAEIRKHQQRRKRS